MVDFRRHKVGSLREQLQRSGVDAAPLALMVHSLSHAIKEAGGLGVDSKTNHFRHVNGQANSHFNGHANGHANGHGNGESGGSWGGKRGRPRGSPYSSEASATFQSALAREQLSADLGGSPSPFRPSPPTGRQQQPQQPQHPQHSTSSHLHSPSPSPMVAPSSPPSSSSPPSPPVTTPHRRRALSSLFFGKSYDDVVRTPLTPTPSGIAGRGGGGDGDGGDGAGKRPAWGYVEVGWYRSANWNSVDP